jgi:c-di-GMP-binding flagellar brake protein YcgR
MGVEEKRQYPRLSLTVEDGYFGQFKTKSGDSIAAIVINLSAGGINLAVAETLKEKISQGDLLVLENFSGGTSLDFLGEIKGEIRWIKDMDIPKYLSVGLRFSNIPDEAREQLNAFVDAERKTRGQYS